MNTFRATYTTKPPAHAEHFQRKGKKLVRWQAAGKVIEGELLDTGRVKVTVTDVWYMRYVNADGKKVREPGFSDREATEAECRRRQTQADRIRAGLESRESVANAGKSLESHLVDYLEYLTAKGRHPDYVASSRTRIGRVIAGAKARTPADLTEHAVTLAVAELRKGPRGIGATTAAAYTSACKSFLEWLAEVAKRIPANPLGRVRREKNQADIRRRRRRLTDPEFERLVKAAEASRPQRRVLNARPHGEARAVLYLVTAHTGFRAEEVASLTSESFDLGHEPPIVALPGSETKNKLDAVQPLPAWLLPRLAAFLATRKPGRPVWPGKWYRRAAELVQEDLAACTPPIPYVDARGRQADFHSLRRAYIGKMAKAADAKVTQRAARHKQFSLTHDIYRDEAELQEVADAVNRFPPVG